MAGLSVSSTNFSDNVGPSLTVQIPPSAQAVRIFWEFNVAPVTTVATDAGVSIDGSDPADTGLYVELHSDDTSGPVTGAENLNRGLFSGPLSSGSHTFELQCRLAQSGPTDVSFVGLLLEVQIEYSDS